MGPKEWIEGGKLLLTLGLAVYQAVKDGDRGKTVGEIFDGAGLDMDEIERLERARFGDRATEPPANPFDDGQG